MKHNLKYVISLVFMLLLTQSTWADPTVTIIKKLNGAVVTETSPGDVTQSIANSKCTLTVTPAQGYYVTKDFITPRLLCHQGFHHRLFCSDGWCGTNSKKIARFGQRPY